MSDHSVWNGQEFVPASDKAPRVMFHRLDVEKSAQPVRVIAGMSLADPVHLAGTILCVLFLMACFGLCR